MHIPSRLTNTSRRRRCRRRRRYVPPGVCVPSRRYGTEKEIVAPARTPRHTGLLYERTTKVCSGFQPYPREPPLPLPCTPVIYISRNAAVATGQRFYTSSLPAGISWKATGRIHRDRGSSHSLPPGCRARVNLRELSSYQLVAVFVSRRRETAKPVSQ